MLERNITLARVLAYLSTLPLVAASIGQLVGFDAINMPLVACAYAAVTIAFIAGIHWAMYLFYESKCPHNLMLSSSLLVLLSWSTMLVNLMSMMLLVQAGCLVFQLFIDFGLKRRGFYPQWLFTVRRNATIISVVMLIILAVL
ncbi:MAG: DUF3429 family protein [Proteobacteria bacterium]|nr:DUF3429 family protein [Pseudomonadota bacterium]